MLYITINVAKKFLKKEGAFGSLFLFTPPRIRPLGVPTVFDRLRRRL